MKLNFEFQTTCLLFVTHRVKLRHLTLPGLCFAARGVHRACCTCLRPSNGWHPCQGSPNTTIRQCQPFEFTVCLCRLQNGRLQVKQNNKLGSKMMLPVLGLYRRNCHLSHMRTQHWLPRVSSKGSFLALSP